MVLRAALAIGAARLRSMFFAVFTARSSRPNGCPLHLFAASLLRLPSDTVFLFAVFAASQISSCPTIPLTDPKLVR